MRQESCSLSHFPLSVMVTQLIGTLPPHLFGVRTPGPCCLPSSSGWMIYFISHDPAVRLTSDNKYDSAHSTCFSRIFTSVSCLSSRPANFSQMRSFGNDEQRRIEPGQPPLFPCLRLPMRMTLRFLKVSYSVVPDSTTDVQTLFQRVSPVLCCIHFAWRCQSRLPHPSHESASLSRVENSTNGFEILTFLSSPSSRQPGPPQGVQSPR